MTTEPTPAEEKLERIIEKAKDQVSRYVHLPYEPYVTFSTNAKQDLTIATIARDALSALRTISNLTPKSLEANDLVDAGFFTKETAYRALAAAEKAIGELRP